MEGGFPQDDDKDGAFDGKFSFRNKDHSFHLIVWRQLPEDEIATSLISREEAKFSIGRLAQGEWSPCGPQLLPAVVEASKDQVLPL